MAEVVTTGFKSAATRVSPTLETGITRKAVVYREGLSPLEPPRGRPDPVALADRPIASRPKQLAENILNWLAGGVEDVGEPITDIAGETGEIIGGTAGEFLGGILGGGFTGATERLEPIGKGIAVSGKAIFTQARSIVGGLLRVALIIAVIGLFLRLAGVSIGFGKTLSKLAGGAS